MERLSWTRRIHRWVAVAFTMCVITNFIAMIWGPPPLWITYSPLLPLAALIFTGLTLLARSYFATRLSRRTNRSASRV